MEKINLWEQVSNRCLKCAIRAHDGETTPTGETVEAVRGLVETAIAVSKIGDLTPLGPGTIIHLGET